MLLVYKRMKSGPTDVIAQENIRHFLQGDSSQDDEALKMPFDISYDIPKNDIELSMGML